MSSSVQELSHIEEKVSLSPSVTEEMPEVRQIKKEVLINKINYMNFRSLPLQVRFFHRIHGGQRTLDIMPQPTMGRVLDGLWKDDQALPTDFLRNYDLEDIQFRDQKNLISLNPRSWTLSDRGISLELPEEGQEMPVDTRMVYKGREISCRIVQHGIMLQGRLRDFTCESFRVEIPREERYAHFGWINEEEIVTLILGRGHEAIYSAFCTINRTIGSDSNFYYFLTPGAEAVTRYPARHYRSTRYLLDIEPVFQFTHPLSGIWTERKIHDLSGTGFSLVEDGRDAALMPGLIIKEGIIKFPNRQRAVCSAQMIHRSSIEEDENREIFTCGMAILDIQPDDHIILMSVLHQSQDPRSYLCKEVDMEELWRFFFESGFIYPEKYAFLQQYRSEILQSYETLYNQRSDIARHFIYQKDNRIMGHLSMVRFYDKSWLIHHHAAAMRDGGRAGIHVLNQIGRYINDTHRFKSMNLDYLICYYRPENRFPHKVFGGLVPEVNNKELCSEDSFAYHYIKSQDSSFPRQGLWSLEQPQQEDLMYLESFYQKQSGGLALEAMDILPTGLGNRDVLQAYAEIGIERDIDVRVLKKNGHLAAIYIANRSAPGLNMSDLINSINLLIINPELCDRDILLKGASLLACKTNSPTVPLLAWPMEYVDKLNLPYEKKYNMWIMKTALGDGYFEHLSKIIRNVTS